MLILTDKVPVRESKGFGGISCISAIISGLLLIPSKILNTFFFSPLCVSLLFIPHLPTPLFLYPTDSPPSYVRANILRRAAENYPGGLDNWIIGLNVLLFCILSQWIFPDWIRSRIIYTLYYYAALIPSNRR